MTQPGTIGDEEMKRLALAAGTIFDSHDLVLKCLDHLVERGAVAADAPDRYVDSLPRGVRRRIEATV